MSHSEKVLKKLAKKATQSSQTSQPSDDNSSPVENLKEQYRIIRDDILKLREDLSKGYDVAKQTLTDRNTLTQILKG